MLNEVLNFSGHAWGEEGLSAGSPACRLGQKTGGSRVTDAKQYIDTEHREPA